MRGVESNPIALASRGAGHCIWGCLGLCPLIDPMYTNTYLTEQATYMYIMYLAI